MSRLQIDPAFVNHPKVIPLSDAAFRLHLRALCYCTQYLTDGKIPQDAIEMREELVKELVDAKLWKPDKNIYVVHDYLEYNPRASVVKRKRSQAAERQREYRERLRERDPIWDTLTELFGEVPVGAKNARGKRNAAVRDLRAFGATPDSIRSAYRRFCKMYERATPTETAISTHYASLLQGTVHANSRSDEFVFNGEPVASPENILGEW